MTVSILVVDVCITDLVIQKLCCTHTAVENLVGCCDRYCHKCGTVLLLHNWKTEFRSSQVWPPLVLKCNSFLQWLRFLFPIWCFCFHQHFQFSGALPLDFFLLYLIVPRLYKDWEEFSVGVAFFCFCGVFLKVLLKHEMLIKCSVLYYGYLKKPVILFKYSKDITWLRKSSQLGSTTFCQSKVLNWVMLKVGI